MSPVYLSPACVCGARRRFGCRTTGLPIVWAVSRVANIPVLISLVHDSRIYQLRDVVEVIHEAFSRFEYARFMRLGMLYEHLDLISDRLASRNGSVCKPRGPSSDNPRLATPRLREGAMRLAADCQGQSVGEFRNKLGAVPRIPLPPRPTQRVVRSIRSNHSS